MTGSEEYWSKPLELVQQEMESSGQGLTTGEAQARLLAFGANSLRAKKKTGKISLLLSQFANPIILILIFAAILSYFLEDKVDTVIILSIVLISGLLGFWQELGADGAVEKLLSIIELKARVLRDGQPTDVALEQVVPGDVVFLTAGGGIPGDCLLLEADGLIVNESALTGETFPVEKKPGVMEKDTPISGRTNVLFMGTHVVSGTGKALVVRTGMGTEFGAVSARLRLRAPETEFEHGVRKFGYLLLEVTLLLVLVILAVNVYLKRPVLDSFLFSLALAVGLTPQLLPAIISINLSRGAKNMAREKVIVKRLSSIENFGSMNVLCSDKTGTLTEGEVKLHSALDVRGNAYDKVLFYAFLNSSFEEGYSNPIDQAVRLAGNFEIRDYTKVSEIPYDFIRKRLSVVLKHGGDLQVVTKGALDNILAVCTEVETSGGEVSPMKDNLTQIQTLYSSLGQQGLRTLGVAYKRIEQLPVDLKQVEQAMTFLGFLVLYDPPKRDIVDTIGQLSGLGIQLKVITGDNRLVAASLGRQIGLGAGIIVGSELHQMTDDVLINKLHDVDLFAEIEPNQKERIILALKKAGNVVGYMGDGINDAPALHSADVGISVNTAVDVAKDAADIVLLEKDLGVLVSGVREGRVTFANTLKYVFMATSANFGNMFSMAGASLFLPFLPLLPKQILLTNLLTDLPEMNISTDSVDKELIIAPRRWDITFIRRFMVIFGMLSSVFDYLTFGALLFILRASPDQFRTGWFVESVISASLIVLVIRTRKPFYRSKPGKGLFWATIAVILLVLVLPFLTVGSMLGFTPLPFIFYPVLTILLLCYIFTAEIAKHLFYKN